MIHRGLRVCGLVLCTGCMSLDFMFLDAPRVDAYDLQPEQVPPELVELVSFDRGDGLQLQGVWLRQDALVRSPPLVYFHGNGGTIESDLPRIEYYWSWGRYDVFAVDYAGFGASEGSASWEDLALHDGIGTLDYVARQTGYATEEIPVVALSLGGFVAIHAIDERPVQAAVLESVFASADLLVDTSLQLDLPPGWFFASDWENVEAIRQVRSPVFVIHGLADDYIDPRSGPMLYEAAAGPKELWQPPRVHHADLYLVAPDAFRERALGFYDRFVP